MIEALKEQVKQLRNRLMMTILQGVIKVVVDSGQLQNVQMSLGNSQTRDGVPRVQQYGFTGNPPPGAFAVMLCAGGDVGNSVVIACDHPTYRPENLASGESQMYDDAGKYIYLSATGIVINANGQDVTINGANHVTINASTEVTLNTPLLRVSGDIIDNYGTNTHNMATMRSIYDTHTHSGVQTGSGNTGIPNQPE